MQTCKKARLLRVRRQEIKDRLNSLAAVLKEIYPELRTTDSDLEPQFVDFAMMPEIRELTDAPSAILVTQEDFAKIKRELSILAELWVIKIQMQLSQVISNTFFEGSQSLFLATAFFDCTYCNRRAMQFPGVCAHECLWPRYYRGIETNDVAYLYQDVAYAFGHCRTWTCQALVKSPASQRARKVIEACGENPDSISQGDMNRKDYRLCCKTCSRDGVKLIMGWRAAVSRSFTLLCMNQPCTKTLSRSSIVDLLIHTSNKKRLFS